MTAPRPYCSPLCLDAAVDELAAHAGAQFEPFLTRRFIAARGAFDNDHTSVAIAAPASERRPRRLVRRPCSQRYCEQCCG